MRRVFIAMLTAVMVFGAVSTIEAKPKNTTDGDETVVFKTNITCDNCKQRIEESIPFEKGVKSVDVNVPEKLVEVEFDSSKTSEDKIRKAIEKLGYTAEKIDADSLKTDIPKDCCRKEVDGKRDSLPRGGADAVEGMPEHHGKGGPAPHHGFGRGGEGRPAHTPHQRRGHNGGIDNPEPPKGDRPAPETGDRPAPPAGERPEPPKDGKPVGECTECVKTVISTVSSDSSLSDTEGFAATVSND